LGLAGWVSLKVFVLSPLRILMRSTTEGVELDENMQLDWDKSPGKRPYSCLYALRAETRDEASPLAFALLPDSIAREIATDDKPASSPIMEITTNNSTKLNPRSARLI
jgi:hypothetical protein